MYNTYQTFILMKTLRVRLVQRMELQRNNAENGIAEKENWPGE